MIPQLLPGESAADGACMRHCSETITSGGSYGFGGVGQCVAFSVSQAPHEREQYCTIWDTLSFEGTGGDGRLDRTCSVVESPRQYGPVAFPEVSRAAHEELVASLTARQDPPGLGPAPPDPPLDRWLTMH